jgi:hypothetical protein
VLLRRGGSERCGSSLRKSKSDFCHLVTYNESIQSKAEE